MSQRAPPEEIRRKAMGGEVITVSGPDLHSNAMSVIRRVEGVLSARWSGQETIEVIVDDAGMATPLLIEALRDADVEVEEISEQHPSFDDVFVRLMEEGNFRAIADYFVDLAKGLIRISSFFFKEIWAAIRQPRLIFSVVLGPFLILAAFGVGYKGQTPELATTLVVPNDPRFSDDPNAYKDMFSTVFVLDHVTRDRDQAQQMLKAHQTDVVVIVPDQPEQTVLSGQHAQFDVLFRQIDPLQAAWVRYFCHGGRAGAEPSRPGRSARERPGAGPADGQVGSQLREQSDGLTADLQAGDAVSAAARVARCADVAGGADPHQWLSVLVALGGEQADPLAQPQADLDAIQADLAQGKVNTPDQIARAQRLQQSSAQMSSSPSR